MISIRALLLGAAMCMIMSMQGRTAVAFMPTTNMKAATTTTTTSSRISQFFSMTTESASADVELIVNPDKKPSLDWELDCYSRPVVMPGNKKLWEVLVTDSNGSFQFRKVLPSNQVNSKELRSTIENLMDEMEDKPSTIRFFRGAMFNMITIALSELDVIARPSRCTFTLAQWLADRHKNVYPKMEGYRSTMAGALNTPSFLDVRTPVRMPDSLRGEKYAFVALPLAEFLPGGGVTEENIGVGKLCPIDSDLPGDAFVQGVVILTQRPGPLATWLAGTEIVGLTCDIRKRMLMMETGIDTQYLMAKLNDQQRQEGIAFEEGKDALGGLHFICVQRDEDDDPSGFWLLRDIPKGI